jgi:hypothetical protein
MVPTDSHSEDRENDDEASSLGAPADVPEPAVVSSGSTSTPHRSKNANGINADE